MTSGYSSRWEHKTDGWEFYVTSVNMTLNFKILKTAAYMDLLTHLNHTSKCTPIIRLLWQQEYLG